MADAPKIQIDSDWKAEAQKEKERLTKVEVEKAKSQPAARGRAGASGAAGEEGSAAPGELPPADFRTIVSMLAQQAIMGLGVMADRKTGGVIVDLEGSRFAIDLLDVMEQKTKGNLTQEEADELKQILADLRTRFVQVATLVSKQMMNPAPGAAAGAGAATASSAATTKPSPIIIE